MRLRQSLKHSKISSFSRYNYSLLEQIAKDRETLCKSHIFNNTVCIG